MSVKNHFQYRIATGRMTLPVAILVAAAVGSVNIAHWTDVFSLAVCALTAYLLIEMNTAFALIRTRTAFPAAMFMIFYVSCPFLYTYSKEIWIPLLLLAAIFSLFRSYESKYASATIFHAFLFLGAGSFLMPHIFYFAPLFYAIMGSLRSLNLRTFFAGLTGILTPYWIMLCYHLYFSDTLEAVYSPFQEAIHFSAIDYSAIKLPQTVSCLAIFLTTAVSCIQSFMSAYQEKVQTRILLRSLIFTETGILLLACLQPQHLNALLPIFLAIGSIMSGHLFALTFNRFTRICFPVIILLGGAVCLFNLWMHLFKS